MSLKKTSVDKDDDCKTNIDLWIRIIKKLEIVKNQTLMAIDAQRHKRSADMHLELQWHTLRELMGNNSEKTSLEAQILKPKS